MPSAAARGTLRQSLMQAARSAAVGPPGTGALYDRRVAYGIFVATNGSMTVAGATLDPGLAWPPRRTAVVGR